MVCKTLKHIIMGFLAVALMSQFFSMRVSAEQFFFYGRYPIFVEGQFFEAWGIDGLRLQDAAYILNGTSAQFDIAEPPCGWDFWIRRGEAYIPDGTELQRISERHANARLIVDEFSDGLHPTPFSRHLSTGWRSWPFRDIVLGLDGNDYPSSTISLLVAYVEGTDDSFFSLLELAYWLGFEIRSHIWECWRGADFSIEMTARNVPTPPWYIRRNTFPIGTRQIIDYAYALRVRTDPGNDYDVLTFVHRGDEFKILDYNGRFVQIETAQGRGWIFAGFLSRELRD
ncbi:MAG: SH3 domain-containing protein [Defluviitaleaceae bacterium]|nr:SH3 domain-containing protein [Defluviitaleaceae bacterium]